MATAEHELLRFFAGVGEAPVRRAVEEFGAPRGLTRGAIVKMADRLHKKGLLGRRVVDHVFVYSLADSVEMIESGYVQKFVDARLKGSVAPLLGFLSENSALSPEEREAMQRIAERLAKDD